MATLNDDGISNRQITGSESSTQTAESVNFTRNLSKRYAELDEALQ